MALGPNPYPGLFVLATDGQGNQHWVSPETAAAMNAGNAQNVPAGDKPKGDGGLAALEQRVVDLLADGNDYDALLAARAWFAANKTGNTDQQASEYLAGLRKRPAPTKSDEQLRQLEFGASEAGRRVLFGDVLRGRNPGFNAFPDVLQAALYADQPALEATFGLDPALMPPKGQKRPLSFQQFLRSGREPMTSEQIRNRLGELSLVNLDNLDPGNPEQAAADRYSKENDEAFAAIMDPYLNEVDPMFRRSLSRMGRTRYEQQRTEDPRTPFINLLRKGSGSGFFGR